MKFDFSREWCVSKSTLEAGSEIGAGLISLGYQLTLEDELAQTSNEARVAFARFINLNRRKMNLTYEKLAECADVEVDELNAIEQDINYEPEPRTIYQLATFFKVSPKKLMALSGLTKPKNTSYIDDAVRYAARSESIESLSDEELAIVEAMVSVLSEKKP